MNFKYFLKQYPGVGPGVLIARKFCANYLKKSVREYAGKIVKEVKNYSSNEFKSDRMKEYNNLLGRKPMVLTLVSHIHGIDSLDACMHHSENVKFFDWADIICLLDHNNFMDDYMLRKTLKVAGKKGNKIILGNERAFWYKPDNTGNRRCISALCELVSYYDLNKVSLRELHSYNPNKSVLSRQEMIKDVIPKHCERIIQNGGRIVIPHLGSTDVLPDFIAKPCQDLKKSSLYIPKVNALNIIPNGVLGEDLENILGRTRLNHGFLIEDINAGVWGVNLDKKYSPDSINYQKMNGLFPHFLIQKDSIIDFFNAVKKLGVGSKNWSRMSYGSFVKNCIPAKFGKFMFNFSYYNMKVRDLIIPWLEGEVCNLELKILSEEFNLAPFSGEDFHGKERVRGSFVIVLMDNPSGLSKREFVKSLTTQDLFNALSNKQCFPVSYNLDTKPLRRFFNYVLRYTAVQKSLFVKRAAEFINMRNKYYFLHDASKKVQYELIKEFNLIKKIKRNDKKEWVWKDNDKKVQVTGYEYYNACIRSENKKSFNKFNTRLDLWSLLAELD